MFMFARYVLLLSSFLSSLWALPLVSRDVVDPPITSPTADTVWYVGQTQTVTWNTTGLPVNQTNPVGMLVLGYLYNNSENLMLNSPLATNISYPVGHVQITVPNVPSRTDYIVVLFGDSGNASPEFTIINDASSSTSVSPSPTATISSGSSPPAVASNPPSTTPPPDNVGNASSTPPATPSTPATHSSTTATAPSSHVSTVHSSTVVTVTATTLPTSANSSAAWQNRAPKIGTSLGISLALIYFAFS